ncbi:phage major capsid protein [Roseitalea porphyridii]|uniref:Phage major capsid protein n=1 Tax=Roseitalea porphyridii TaxID=1852022 RepID=A0A4P6V246_9HYPH|nr:phage major capsid protein [Roseitalea porphyridii]QBK30774.1 phage major capsid protein [Roseitalea porphyridii]
MSVNFEEIKALIEDQGEAFSGFKSSIEGAIEAERKEREALEMRLNRIGVAGGGEPNAGKLDDERKAVAAFIRTGDETELKNVMTVGSDPDGGYTVLPAQSRVMTQRLHDFSALRRLARVEVINTGDSFEEIDDRDEPDAAWVGETATRSKGSTPTLGKFSIPLHEIYALQAISQRLIDDSNVNLGLWIEGKIADKFGRTEADALISGDGTLKPKGLLSYATNTDGDYSRAAGTIEYVPTGEAAAFPTDDPGDVLVNLMVALRAPYRTGARWLMNSNTMATVRKFKDTQGQYLWQPAMAAGQPATLLGYPVEIDEYMPDVGANEYPIAFGRFDLAYTIIERPGIRMLRDPYTDKPNVLFYAYRRIGGGLANDDAVKLLKVASS